MDQVNGILWMLLGDRTTSEGANNSPDGTTQAATNVAVTKETTTTTETFSAPAGLVAMFRCGECIGCFQTDDCGKCDGCAGGQPCFKRKCVQESILMQRHNRALAQKAAPRKETSEAPKKDAKQDAATSATKRGPGRPRKDGHPPNARGVGAQHANGDENMDERLKFIKYKQSYARVRVSGMVLISTAEPARRPTARAQTSRRRHEAPKQVESRQCIEPDCVKPARDNSKYCSDECGLKLAKLRLLMMLPEKVEQYYKEQPQSELQALEELRAIDQKIGQIQVQTETMLGYVRTIQRYVMAMKSTTSVSYDEPGDVDFMVNCTVCGMETNGRQLPKHVERCFVRSEKQTSFGTATPAAFNPDNLFCEAYNKANNTYCKRVRVICAEHYKGELENELQICAYPKAWAEGKSLTFAEMFEHGPDLLKDQGFCCAPRKECAQHHRWVQALVGTIECERMNLLTRLDELLERRKTVSVGCATRGDVISLLNFKPPIIAERSN
ncbi:hypothetical protein Y032_0078g1160 [Ancylostoma ceylanicum]|uniref:CXXC-type zinc finger protein 1 n=2 Tax=Ancylostoma ceylanicum TaxID=53326 RepID=A0A016TUK6_9BILA|nr:hypothetical protein Y032_0078g1160 [Ancylostoma ceylanicum]